MTEAAEQKTELLDVNDVADFLSENPNFLLDHPELLAQVNLQHLETSSGGNTVSLIEKQVSMLRQKNQLLEQKLSELVDIARTNEQLSNHLHGFASNLLETRSISDVLAITEDVMRDVFKIDFVTMRMLSDVTDDMLLAIDEETESELFAEFFTLNQPTCGQLDQAYIDYFFDEQAVHVASSAMLPLKSVQHLGILMLGSVDAERFSQEHGLLFLSHISDLISSALVAHLHQ